MIYDKMKNKRFFDRNFIGEEAIYLKEGLGSQLDCEYDVDQWVRLKEMKDKDGKWIKHPQLIVDDMRAGDISQGTLGDWWFLSALSVVAYSRPELILKLIHPKSRKYIKNGIYVIRFYILGEQQIVYVDDNFPVDENKQSVFCKVITDHGASEFWPILLEKAYAKLYGGYIALEKGRPENALVDIWNGISEVISFDTKEFIEMKNNGVFWAKLKAWINRNYLLAASSKKKMNKRSNHGEKPTDLGLIEGHAYAVLDVAEIDEVRLIMLRNPWGKGEWKGAWSDYDNDNWTEKRRRKIEKNQRLKGREYIKIGIDDGVFWMTIPDFLSNYISLSIVRIYEYPEWRKYRVTGEWKEGK
jgi:hypothetical protein